MMNDIHFPYEGPAYRKALKLIQKTKDLRGIYLNGDIAEIESVSSHSKHPRSNKSLMYEIDYTNEKLDELQKAFSGVNVTYICGNHEGRIYRYIRDIAPEMFGLIDCPSLLKFEKRSQWKFIDYSPYQWVKCGATKDLWLRHEPLGSGAMHAKATAEKSYVSVLYGHTHVYQQYTHKKMGPEPYLVTATSGGWLGDINKNCFDYRGSKDNWVNGFTIIECDESSGEYELKFQKL